MYTFTKLLILGLLLPWWLMGGCGTSETTTAQIENLEYRASDQYVVDLTSKSDPLEYLNSLRRQAGVTILQSDNSLEDAAVAHARYLVENNLYTHDEEEDAPDFTGGSAGERAIASGYSGKFVSENIYAGDVNAKEAIDILLSNIYHRFAFLDDDIDAIGIAGRMHAAYRFKRVYTYEMGQNSIGDTGTGERPEYVTWPYAGQSDLLPVFYEEEPDPLPGCSVSGYPISIVFDPSQAADMRLEAFNLYDQHHHPVTSTVLLDRESDPNGRFGEGEYALMPMHRLEWGSRYDAEVRYRKRGSEPVTIKWSFSTRKLPGRVVRVTDTEYRYHIKSGEKSYLYMVPEDCNDHFQGYRYRYAPTLKIEEKMVDLNTIYIRASGKGNIEIETQNGKHYSVQVD